MYRLQKHISISWLNLQVEARTAEAAPEGTVEMFATINGSRGILVNWLSPNKPNGHLIYTVLVAGLFYADQGIFFVIHLALPL